MTDKRPHIILGTGWRYATEHSMLRRLDGHDYRGRSIYQITITLADRSKPRLGNLRWTEKGEAVVDLTPLGECVRRAGSRFRGAIRVLVPLRFRSCPSISTVCSSSRMSRKPI